MRKKTTTDLKVGIIGVGGIAEGKHMPALAKIGSVKLAAFCDLVEERATTGAEKYGIKGATVYTDFRQMLAKEKLDVVHVCTANDTHSMISVAALEAGCHVMCEKPMHRDAAGARAMVQAARLTGKKLTIGYQNRFRADSLYLKKLCEDGELGEIYYAKALAVRRRAVPTWGVFLDKEKQGGGPLIDIGTHALDLTLWMMNNYEPTLALGSVYYKLNSRENAANAWGPWDPKVYTAEDSAFGFIKFANGATVSLESSWAINLRQAGESRCTLVGTEAGADMNDGLQINGERFGRLYDNKILLQVGGVDFYDAAGDNPADLEAHTWIKAVLNDTAPVVLPEQALVVTEILEALYESGKTGQPVTFGTPALAK
jgi:predicted dehydrogenase